MAIKLISNYAKRLGLPGYSSHQFSVSVETELSDLEEVNAEVSRLYHDLQAAVDREIQLTGFVPDEAYGVPPAENAQTHRNGHRQNGAHSNASQSWNCSEKQQALILRLVNENSGLDHESVEHLARERFGVSLVQLNRLQASGLIEELLEICSSKKGTHRNGNRKGASR